ncbi:MAG: M48 family metalloprotease [Desulfobacterales bacterium]
MKYFAILIVVCCLSAGCMRPQAVPVNEALRECEDEQMLWRRVEKEQDKLDASGLLYRNPALENYLNRVAKKLQANSIAPDFRFQIRVLKDPNLNAFAFPNGVIYLHTGILSRMDNEDQLAALLSHEMTHCTHRHSLRVIRSISDQPAYLIAIKETLARISMVQEVARALGIAGSLAAVTGYTRELETEADLVGLDLMAKANYDPRETLKLFDYLKQEIEAEDHQEPFFFGTHPNVEQRIDNATKWLAERTTDKDNKIKNTEEFQHRIQEVVLTNVRLDLSLGRFEIARKTVEKYLRMRPDDARGYFLYGEILRQRDRPDDSQEAMNYFRKSIALDPSLPDPHKAMGLILYKQGEKHLAKKFFESCLRLSPNDPDGGYIRSYLKNCSGNGERS